MTMQKPPTRIISSEPNNCVTLRRNRHRVFYHKLLVRIESFSPSKRDSIRMLSHFHYRESITVKMEWVIDWIDSWKRLNYFHWSFTTDMTLTHSSLHPRPQAPRWSSISPSVDEHTNKFVCPDTFPAGDGCHKRNSRSSLRAAKAAGMSEMWRKCCWLPRRVQHCLADLREENCFFFDFTN